MGTRNTQNKATGWKGTGSANVRYISSRWAKLMQDFKVEYSEEFISSLWCRKIPNTIAEQAQEEWLEWYYTEKEKGKYKRCSKCGQNKLSIPRYFTRNKTSKDGLYSICKECRNKKVRPL